MAKYTIEPGESGAVEIKIEKKRHKKSQAPAAASPKCVHCDADLFGVESGGMACNECLDRRVAGYASGGRLEANRGALESMRERVFYGRAEREYQGS